MSLAALAPGQKFQPLCVHHLSGPGERMEDFRARIGQVFDDTLQLQLDVLGQNYGLSKVPKGLRPLMTLPFFFSSCRMTGSMKMEKRRCVER